MSVVGRVVTIIGSLFLILLLVVIPISETVFPEVSISIISTACILALLCIRRSRELLFAGNAGSRAPPA